MQACIKIGHIQATISPGKIAGSRIKGANRIEAGNSRLKAQGAEASIRI